MNKTTFLERLAAIGTRSDAPRDERLRAGALILASVVISLLSCVWVLTYALTGHPLPAAIPAAYQVVTVVSLVVVSHTKRFDVFRTTQLALFLLLPGLLQASLGGFSASSGIVLWSLMTPLAAVALLGVRPAIPWLVGFGVVLVVLAVADPWLRRDPADLPATIVTSFSVLNIAGLTTGTFVLLGYFVHQRDIAQRDLEAERARSERLLRNVLPAEIADRLKERDDVIAERHDDVTVLFADLVGFTELAARMDAGEVVELLDEIFAAFDVVTDEEGLEKIKTIGDEYMAVAGAPTPRQDHADAIARGALAMRREVTRIATRRGIGDHLAIRIGIHSGTVVAGVIGRRRLIYDLWGDTVNIASRMESHGIPGEIQLSAHTATLLQRGFEVAPRGIVDVKSKGPMQTFLLETGDGGRGLAPSKAPKATE